MLIENKNIQKIDINSLKMSTQSINERYSKLSEPLLSFLWRCYQPRGRKAR